MSTWSDFWYVVVIVSMTCFGVLAVFVVIGGFRDLLAMFRRIERQHEKTDSDRTTKA